MWRPRPARWFEILAARDDATLLLEALARTGAVELEARSGVALPNALAELLPALSAFVELQSRYHAWWPAPERCRPSAFPEAPALTLQRSLAMLRAWARQAEPLIQKLQQAQAEADELALWQQVLPALQARPLEARQLAAAGPWLGVRLFTLPAGRDGDAPLPLAQGVVATRLEAAGRQHLLVVAAPEAMAALGQAIGGLGGSAHRVPDGLLADAGANLEQLALRRQALAQRIEGLRQALSALAAAHELPRALGDAHRLRWLLHNVHALEAGELLCWITGWCADADEHRRRLALAVQQSGARALLHFTAPPPAARAPLLFDNPRWARPFELFSRALGMPAATEVDPSPLLALAVPLMFGYMFGDVGQGLVIAGLAWWQRERLPIARLLVVGGLSAAAFGFLFGSLFGLHGLLPALWLHPLDAPLPVLLAPLLGGVLLLSLGLLLDALQAFWRGEWRRWALGDAGLIPLYLALLAAFAEPRALLLGAAALLWYCAGRGWLARRVGAAFAALGEALEKTLQILVNTLSFARIGAFALAHAGLSSAIVALMEATDSLPLRALVLLLGNLLVILLEAMVVSIQTTRLVLFEFFTRFMQGQGRVFRPLPAPPYPLQPPVQES